MIVKITSLAIATTCLSIGLASAAKADTVTAHCDLYRPGESYPGISSNCTFSQRQGYIGIQMQSTGVRYNLSPQGGRGDAGLRLYTDDLGHRITQTIIGNEGQSFAYDDGTKLNVFWDPNSSYGNPSSPSADRVGVLVAHDRASQINLRSEPTIQSHAHGYGLAGDQVNILECQQDADTPSSNLNWCQVQFRESGAIGWIRSDFIIFPSDGE